MHISATKVLVVEDFEQFRRFVVRALQPSGKFQIIETPNGLEALQQAKRLQPDLVLLDIGLPDLNGVEVARRLRKLVPAAKIVFLSDERSPDVVREALRLGALGYIHKSRASSDLLPAIDAVLEGRRFVSSGLEIGRNLDAKGWRRHAILFCSNDTAVVDGLARFIADALKAGDPAIVWATGAHRQAIREKLEVMGINSEAATQRGVYVASDVNEPPDAAQISETLKRLAEAASDAGNKQPRVSMCGERAGSFWESGKTEEAMQLEQLINDLAERYPLDVLCVYPSPQSEEDRYLLKKVCAEHSEVSFT